MAGSKDCPSEDVDSLQEFFLGMEALRDLLTIVHCKFKGVGPVAEVFLLEGEGGSGLGSLGVQENHLEGVVVGHVA